MKKQATSRVLPLLSMAPSAFVDTGELPRIMPKDQIRSVAALRKEVQRWSERQSPPMSNQDVDAVVDWLNRNFYRLAK